MSPALTPYYTFDGEQLIKGVWELIILDPGSRISWSDLHPFNGEANEETLKTIYLVPDLLSGGDYSNSSEVQVSNHRSFLKEFKNVEGVYDVWGGFGSFAVAIRADVAESNEQIKSLIRRVKKSLFLKIGLMNSDMPFRVWRYRATRPMRKERCNAYRDSSLGLGN